MPSLSIWVLPTSCQHLITMYPLWTLSRKHQDGTFSVADAQAISVAELMKAKNYTRTTKCNSKMTHSTVKQQKQETYCCCCLPRPGPSSSQSRFPLSRWLNARIDPTGFRHRSSDDKSAGCVVQANRCLTSCGEAPQSVHMLLGSPNTLFLQSCNRWQSPDHSCESVHHCLRLSLCSSSDIGWWPLLPYSVVSLELNS